MGIALIKTDDERIILRVRDKDGKNRTGVKRHGPILRCQKLGRIRRVVFCYIACGKLPEWTLGYGTVRILCLYLPEIESRGIEVPGIIIAV